MKKLLNVMAFLMFSSVMGNAHAFDLVLDVTNLVQTTATAASAAATKVSTEATRIATEAMQALEEAAWFQQAKDMYSSLTGMKNQFDSLSNQVMDPMGTLTGVIKDRGWQNTTGITPADRNYLPDTYQEIIDEGNDPKTTLGAATKYYKDQVNEGNGADSLLPKADFLKALGDSSKAELEEIEKKNLEYAALNRSLGDEIYRQAAIRTNNLQKLQDRIKDAKDPKDIWDLEAQLLNEQIKLEAIALVQKSQREMDEERKKVLIKEKLETSFGW